MLRKLAPILRLRLVFSGPCGGAVPGSAPAGGVICEFECKHIDGGVAFDNAAVARGLRRQVWRRFYKYHRGYSNVSYESI